MEEEKKELTYPPKKEWLSNDQGSVEIMDDEEEDLPNLIIGMFEELVVEWLERHGTDAFAQAMLATKRTQLNKSSKKLKRTQ